MKKSLFCIATALMLTGCAEFLPSDDVLEVAPQSFQEYLLRQEDELQEVFRAGQVFALQIGSRAGGAAFTGIRR